MGDLGNRIYVGDGNRRYEPLKNAWNEREPYTASPALAEAVNVALYLRRPLLLEGEPGCGKTQLAYAVAYELGFPLMACYIRSTTRAQDLLYTYDAVKRLYDIEEMKTREDAKSLPPREQYVTLGKLGRAIELAQGDTSSVVLIDEIDKADIDFPNDLLLELDRLRFEVTEAEEGHKYDALKGQYRRERKDYLTLIIITSNREKELPKPFLRRCLFHYIEFPDHDTLEAIIKTHFQRKTITSLFKEALKKFWALRQQPQFTWRKMPGTSELLDWVHVLEQKIGQSEVEITRFQDCGIHELPFLEALVKTQSDLNALKKSRT